MNERQWELYRLSVAEQWPDTPLKRAVIAAIKHRLREIDLQTGIQREKTLAASGWAGRP